MKRDVEQRIAGLAARQHGVATRRQLLEAGLSRFTIVHRVASGRLTPLHRGVYLALPVPLPHTRFMAAVLACGAGAALSHGSGASLWEWMDVPDAHRVDVTVARNRGRRPGIRVHRVPLEQDERTEKDGIPVTTPGRTLLDLAAVLSRRELEGVVARADRERLVPLDTLPALLARYRGHRGVPSLETVLGQVGGPALTRSAAEETFLALVEHARLERPRVNVRVGPYELDFLWRDVGIAVEIDGFRYHSARARFEGDRRRDAQLAAAGIAVIRLSWRQITQEAMPTAVQLGQVLARAELGRPVQSRDRPSERAPGQGDAGSGPASPQPLSRFS